MSAGHRGQARVQPRHAMRRALVGQQQHRSDADQRRPGEKIRMYRRPLPAEAEVVLKAIGSLRGELLPRLSHRTKAGRLLAKAPDMTTVRRQAMIWAAALAITA